MDGSRRALLQQIECNALILDPSLQFYKLDAIQHLPMLAGGWTPAWFPLSATLGGSPSPCTFGAPKKGKARMYARPVKLDKTKYSAHWKRTPHVRHGASRRVQAARAKWSLIAKMTAAGFLKAWSKHTCPHCGMGKVSPLEQTKAGTWAYRCRRKNC